MSDKPIKWSDQFWHVILAIVLNIPFLGSFIGVNMREYYQRKRTMEKNLGFEPEFFEIMDTEGGNGYEGYDWFKRDLVAGYIGVIIGGVVVIVGLVVWF